MKPCFLRGGIIISDSVRISLGSASLWMHHLGTRERSKPTLLARLSISTKNQLCLVKDLAVTGY